MFVSRQPDASQREMAEHLGMSVGAVHYVLKALLAKGLIKVHNFRVSDNKRGYSYVLTQEGMSEKTRAAQHFLTRKLEEYNRLQADIEILKKEIKAEVQSCT